MKRFKNILLLYECDRATLDRATTLAKNNRARLTVVQVVKNMPQQWEQVHLGGTPPQKMLDELLAEHTDGTARVHMIKGYADSVIPHIAKTEKVDLLVMGTVYAKEDEGHPELMV